MPGHKCFTTGDYASLSKDLHSMIVSAVLNDFFSKIMACSGVGRPGPTMGRVLPSTFQALPSRASKKSRDSIMN